jgi:hypothetical protein
MVSWFNNNEQDRYVLYVANIKGIGSRNQSMDRKGYNSHDHLGSVSIIPLPDTKELEKMTETVNMNNSWVKLQAASESSAGKSAKVPVPVKPGMTSPIKHVVYIIKENRTYDQVLVICPRGTAIPVLYISEGRSLQIITDWRRNLFCLIIFTAAGF